MKLFNKLFILLFVCAFGFMGANAQNVSINILTQNSGQVGQGGTVFVQIDITNTDPVNSVPVYKLRPQISVPASIASIPATGHTLPAGWSITFNSGSVIRLSNGTDEIPANTTRTALIAVQGNTLGGPSTISGNLLFSNGVAPGSASGTATAGDNTADNSSTSTIEVITAPACALTVSASAGTISCNGGTATLTATASGATGAVEYSLNGGAYQSSNTFTVDGTASPYTVVARVVANTSCTATSNAVTVVAPAAITASASAGTILCNGGTTTLTVTASGGTGALQYSLNGGAYQSGNTFTVNAAGSPYVVTVKDANNCTKATSSVAVTQPTTLSASSTHTPIVCGGSSTVTVSATGGTAPYTGTGTFSQPAGSHVYTVTDANGCSATTTVNVVAPNGPSVSSSQTTVQCFGGSSTVTISATGGTAPYTGTGAFTQAGGTTQSYTVTDANGCSSSTSVTVAQPAQVPVPTINSTNNGNGTFTLTASNFTGTLLWSTNETTSSITVSQAGAYSVTQTVGSCTSNAASITVTIGNAIADPAVGQMFFTNLSDISQDANTLLFTQKYKLKAPVYNLNQFTAVPSSAINFRVNLGTKLRLDAAYNLATAPLSQYFSFSSAIVADSQIVTGVQIAELPADFDGIAVFEVNGTLSCTSEISSNIVITNSSANVTDEDLNNNEATLQYTLPVTISATPVHVTCNGAANGSITVVVSPGATYVIKNASNQVVTAPFAPGVYTVEATSTGDAPISNTCANTATVTITEPVVLAVTVVGTTPSICNGGNSGTITVSSTGGTAPYTYTIAGPTVNTTGATTGVFTGLTAGVYTITSTDAHACTATATATVSQPTTTNPDLSLGSDISGSMFATNGTSQTIVYNIAEIAGNPAVGDTLRITKVAGFDISFNTALTSATIAPTTYTLDNANWKVDNSNPAFISIIKVAAGGAQGPGTIYCGERVNIAITLTRNTTNISTFPLSARVRKANDELNLSNNFNSIIFTAE